MFEITINHDLRPNDYIVSEGRIIVSGVTMSQREELFYRAKVKMSRMGLKPYTCALKMYLYICRRQDPMKPYFGDGDNFVKWVADALQGAVYLNDAQIQEYHVYKMKVLSPCLQVKIEPFELKNLHVVDMERVIK